MPPRTTALVLVLAAASLSGQDRQDGAVEVRGVLAQWHKITLTVSGPRADERDTDPNPFVDYRMTVTFEHESGEPRYAVPGYFAADGNAAETSAMAGDRWRAHLSPDRVGTWSYRIAFVRGAGVALAASIAGEPVSGVDGLRGSFVIAPSPARGRDFRAHGRLQYVGRHHLRYAGSGEYFLKAGPDAPETLLAYRDFDGTETKKAKLKTWAPHVGDFRAGGPTWQDGRGKGLLGALEYLAGAGCNAVSFLTYNAGGDGDNVWPFVTRDSRLHYDCSKLDQWQRVFDHAQSLGLYLHFKLQETENDDGGGTALDGGELGTERRLYCRELIARFGHALALNWNLGEENSQTPAQQRALADYLRAVDPYDHHIVVHTYPDQQDRVYDALLGERSVLTGASLQNGWNAAHRRTRKWVRASARAGRPWVVTNDEQNPASMGVPPDPGYRGHDGRARQGGRIYDLHDIRKAVLWGTLMAGGAGVEYYFGYQLPANDLLCEDYRSRAESWQYCRIALAFFHDEQVPFWDMSCRDELVSNPAGDNSRYCLAKSGELYLVYLPDGGTVELDLSGVTGDYAVRWFDPRAGGSTRSGSTRQVTGGAAVPLGSPPEEPTQDWLVVVRAR